MPHVPPTFTVGFTGTQKGLTPAQVNAIANRILDLYEYEILDDKSNYIVLRHGDCIGADSDIHDLWLRTTDIKIVKHPGYDPEGMFPKRAFKDEGVCMPAAPYLERNQNIVDCSDVLWAAPKTPYETMRSGTWATVRYAIKKDKRVVMFYPDGEVDYEYT